MKSSDEFRSSWADLGDLMTNDDDMPEGAVFYVDESDGEMSDFLLDSTTIAETTSSDKGDWPLLADSADLGRLIEANPVFQEMVAGTPLRTGHP